MRSRISSQCLKRSIRTSEQFKLLCGGIRTRQLARLIADKVDGKADTKKRAIKILDKCGIKSKDDNKSDMLVYTTQEAINSIAKLIQDNDGKGDGLADRCGDLISQLVAVPDMALCGRMLETGVLANTTVNAALQTAHAISTHEARLEVDYYVAADDIPGDDAGAGYVDEAMFASACFYKYFSIHWEQLLENLAGFQGNKEHLAAHTVGAFLRSAALANPTGKQNSFAAHNPPDGILVEIKDGPISYANAFAKPVPSKGPRDMVSQSIADLAQYVGDIDTGYGRPKNRFWFSPNLRYPLTFVKDKQECTLADENLDSLKGLVESVVQSIGFDWNKVQSVIVN